VDFHDADRDTTNENRHARARLPVRAIDMKPETI
jgi:hypothetical protein